MQKQLGNN